MASIRTKTRKDGVRFYEVRYREPNGRMRSKCFLKWAPAVQFRTEIEATKLHGTYVDPTRGRMLFKEWIVRWQETTGNLRPSTRARDASYVASHLMPTFGEVRLADIDQLQVRTWAARLSGSGLAPATTQKAYQIMAKITAAAVDAGLIAQSPCRNIPLPRVERQEMRFLNPSQIAALADAIDPRYRALVLVAAYGGLRMGELAGLRRHRVELLRGEVDVAEIAVEVRGHVLFGQPKTRAGRRRVGLPRSVVRELTSHLATHTSEAPDGFVFPNMVGGPIRASGFRRQFFGPAVRAAGLSPLRPHDLRHTAVALWIAAGADPKQVAVRAGHTSVAFTLDRYGHLYPEADERLRDRLEGMFAAAIPPVAAPVVALRP